jgi:hypothetical protein
MALAIGLPVETGHFETGASTIPPAEIRTGTFT